MTVSPTVSQCVSNRKFGSDVGWQRQCDLFVSNLDIVQSEICSSLVQLLYRLTLQLPNRCCFLIGFSVVASCLAKKSPILVYSEGHFLFAK
jgi:hypothetical protein